MSKPGRIASITGLVILAMWPLGMTQGGEKTYKARCSMCHGDDGKGNPSIARLMKVEFKAMSSDYVQKKTDDEIIEIVTRGKSKMVPVRGVTTEQIRQIIAYIRTLRPKQ